MAKYLNLDEKAKRDLNKMCKMHGYDFPLGDWLASLDATLEKLDLDSGVADTDYDDTLGIDGQ